MLVDVFYISQLTDLRERPSRCPVLVAAAMCTKTPVEEIIAKDNEIMLTAGLLSSNKV